MPVDMITYQQEKQELVSRVLNAPMDALSLCLPKFLSHGVLSQPLGTYQRYNLKHYFYVWDFSKFSTSRADY